MRPFALVLHTHLPYVRKNGTYPCGEDFFHQAANESYLPLLDVLSRIRVPITLGITPVLAGQMQDPYMLLELESYLARVELRAWRQVANTPSEFHPAARAAAVRARASRDRLASLDGGGRGIASAFAALEREGVVQIAGGPAAHPLLSRVSNEAMLRAHLRAGVDEHVRVFGHAPTAMWLPECAYAPGRGIEQALEACGVRSVVVDAHMIDDTSEPVGVGTSGVAALGIDRNVADIVWRNEGGIPSGEWYLDFHHHDFDAGFRNWRVTDHTTGIGEKRWYEPERAHMQAERDAHRFVAALEQRFDALGRDDAVVVAAFDTELLGHWWHEGPLWLEHVLGILSKHESIRCVTLDEALAAAPPRTKVELPEGTWGAGGDHRTWASESMWADVARAEERTLGIAARSRAGAAAVLREFLLLAASDWPYMTGTGQAAQYGRERFAAHLERHDRIASAVERDDPAAERIARELFDIDNAFPGLDGALAELA